MQNSVAREMQGKNVWRPKNGSDGMSMAKILIMKFR